MTKGTVRVGMGVFVFKGHKFLMIQRLGSHGAGTWSVPGGHIEFGESFEDTARREVKEETDLDITNIRFAGVTNDYFADESKHYITVWMTSDWASGKERIVEPDKCPAMEWRDFDSLPDTLFQPCWSHLLSSGFIGETKHRLQA